MTKTELVFNRTASTHGNFETVYTTARNFFGKQSFRGDAMIDDDDRLLYKQGGDNGTMEGISREAIRKDVIERYKKTDDKDIGDRILRKDFELTLTKLKNKKARGIDNIPV